MKKIIRDKYATVVLEGEEPIDICRLGGGTECCAFLLAGHDGFECCKMDSLGDSIRERLLLDTMVSKGVGEWEGCAWHK